MHSTTSSLRRRSAGFAQSTLLRFVCFALFMTTPLVRAQTAATGTVRGQVSNNATKQNLQGVTVLVKETGRQVVTENGGNYILTGLEPGTYTLVFEYPGLDLSEQTVSVGAGASAKRDVALNSDVYLMDVFVVAGEREGNAAAIAAQRNSTNVKNIITSDAFGSIAKGNIGNFLKRLPGIAGTTDEVETENIVLRGMGAEFTALDIDGARATSGGGGRSQNAAAIPADMIEKVEVVKALTPDMDPDSMGGRINLVTKSAFDRKGRHIDARVAGSHSFTYGKDVGRKRDNAHAPSFLLAFTDTFSVFGGENNLGVIAMASWERILDVRGTTSWGDNYNTPNAAAGGDGKEYPRFNNVSTALHGTTKSGGSLRVDYKLSPELTVGSTVAFNRHINDMYRVRNRLRNGTVRPAVSTPDRYLVVVDGANYGTENSIRHQTNDTWSGRLYADYRNDADWKVETAVSAYRTEREQTGTSQSYVSNRKIDYALDRRDGLADVRWPTVGVLRDFYTGTTSTTTSLPSNYLPVNPFGDDFSNARTDGTSQWQQVFQKNSRITGSMDVSKGFSARWPIEVKTGVRYQGTEVDQWRDDLRGTVSTAYGTNLSAILDPTWDLGGAIGRYPVGTMTDPDAATRLMGISYRGPNADPTLRWNYDPTRFTINPGSTRQNTLENDRTAWEDIVGTYLQGEIAIGKLEVLTGLRYETTTVDTVQTLRNRQAVGTNEEFTGRVNNTADYEKLFPSLHLKYVLTKKVQIKAAYSTSSGRPDWGSILDAGDIDYTDHEVSVPNLALKPRYSKNYDLAVEYYFSPVGQVSVGVFQKDITDFDANTSIPITRAQAIEEYGATPTDDVQEWFVETKKNVGEGRVRGIELNYSQQMSDLFSGAWGGFGVFGNYTYLKTEGTFNLDTSNGAPQKRNRLQKFIPRTANAGLSYIHNRFDLRLSWNYTSAWDENTQLTNIGNTKVRGRRWQLDFGGRYNVTKNVTYFLDLINLTSTYGLKYRGFEDPVYRNETNALGFVGTTGVLLSF